MFIPVKSDNGARIPWEYLPAAKGTYKAGQLLNVSGGQVAALTAASATTPPYLCMADREVEAGEPLPVTRISHDHIYETQLSAAAASTVVGDKLQVAAGGLEAAVPGSGSSGTFELVSMEGTAKGDFVRGRWV